MNSDGRSSGFDETIESRPTPAPDLAHAPRKPARNVTLIEGSTPELGSETYELLRRRLQSASIVMFGGFAAFLIYGFVSPYSTETWSESPWMRAIILAAHTLMTLVTGLVALRLCMHCPRLQRRLRLAELAVFGGSALLFALLTFDSLSQGLYVSPIGYVNPFGEIWLMLIFTYALFIPNSLRRASVIIGVMAAIPVVLVAGFWVASWTLAGVVPGKAGTFVNAIFEMTMIMALAAAAAVWGSHTIGLLRRKAFEAQQFGQYRLKRLLGSGGMGEVHLAEHLMLKRPCAVKLIRPDKAGDGQALARFEREVKATAKLTHWNTVEIYDYGRTSDGTFYYVMEYLPGLTLGQLVEMHGPLPPARVIHLLAQTCEALAEAHAEDLIHRDIKPANIFAAKRGGVYDVAKLLDFGLAKPLTDVETAALTQEGTITGSPLFMSPEQVEGERHPDARSDIYSLGAVAYYVLAGEPPFNHATPIKVMMAQVRDEPTPPSRVNPNVPHDLEQVVLKCLEKDPDHRFQNAEQLRQALLTCDAAGQWDRLQAAEWWQCHGCPRKKALDVAVLEGAAV